MQARFYNKNENIFKCQIFYYPYKPGQFFSLFKFETREDYFNNKKKEKENIFELKILFLVQLFRDNFWVLCKNF